MLTMHSRPRNSSYYMDCVKCTGFQVRELFVFFAVILLPPTVLCIVVTLFHLNVLHPPWSVFVLMAQILSIPALTQIIHINAKLHNGTRETRVLYSILATLYGPWNLDFFRAIYGSICISPHITQLQSAAIEGCVGLYPLTLLSMLYLAVKLRDRGSPFVTKVWKPFNFLFSRFRSRLNLKSSFILKVQYKHRSHICNFFSLVIHEVRILCILYSYTYLTLESRRVPCMGCLLRFLCEILWFIS